MAAGVVEVCKQIEDDGAIRIAIFTGAGEKAFSAGMDLKRARRDVVLADRTAQSKSCRKSFTPNHAPSAP